MNDVPGTIPRPSAAHPRRPPAHQSVCLRHSPPRTGLMTRKGSRRQPQASSTSPVTAASDQANPPSSVSAQIANKHSSGESSDAGKWFESTNNNAVQSEANASFNDNDPPFFLRNSSSSETPPDGQDPRTAPWHPATSMPYRPSFAHFGTDGSSGEDFRSVIDDLTVANKRLKQKLRKYEKLYDAHLQDEKLFEVRFHGLPDHKKKELEETLRKFASDLSDSPLDSVLPSSYAPPMDHHKTASSTSRFADSGFASMSASGQNSMSAPSGLESDHRKISKSQFNQQQQNIQSYLHDIPTGLLPRENLSMSEKAKKKLVVRRLEQIFAGKLSVPGHHPQPMQQEEVAQSAAMADRQAKEATGQQNRKEGLRVARIMPVQAEDEDIIMHPPPENLQKLPPNLNINEQDFAGSGSPDQRPTRPLDLDPYRAQVPADNMEYIRHLGFTPPDMASGEALEDGHGWIYLNLLINMAQLHTINVTPDFVKDAVDEYSSKFELSHDGRKIRWKGGYGMTRSGGSSSEHYGDHSPYDPTTGSPNKRIKTGHSGASSVSTTDRQMRVRRAAKERDQNKLTYTPLFFHKEESEDEEDYYHFDRLSSANSALFTQQRGDSSGFGSSAMQTTSSRKRRDDGPIIFYNKAKFCTDLSGDRRGLSFANPSSYHSITSRPLGAGSSKLKSSVWTVSEMNDMKGPLDTSLMDLDSKDGDRLTSSGEEMEFSPEHLQNDAGNDTPQTVQFEASGLGGVQPDDNFSIRVRRSQFRAGSSPPKPNASRTSQFYPRKIREALNERASAQDHATKQHMVVKEEILSSSRKDLPSSTLPPASFLPFDSTSSGDVDSDLESEVSSSASTNSSSDRNSETGLRLVNLSPIHLSEEADTSEESEVDSDSDSEVDFLATARKLDPNTIRASEREYDAAVAERLAEEIPAGSSAATAGGLGLGSGFNSPESNVPTTGEDAASGSATRSKTLKRTRTSDSVSTTLQSGKQRRE